jgi:endonuclease/exonuclease/phosphatase (EEP) superfamily protein YafD
VRRLLLTLTVLLLLVALATLLPGWIPTLLGAFSFWVLLPGWLLLLAALALRDRALIGLSLPPVLLHGALVVPDLAPAQPPPTGPTVHLLSANLLMVHPDPLPLARMLLARDADILLLQEVSDRWVAALSQSGILASYPHQLLHAQNDSFGTAILSRLPLTDARIEDFLGVPLTAATIQLGGQDIDLLNIHTLPPRTGAYFQRWQAQMDLLAGSVGSRPLALIGDLNTTQHSRAYRRLLSAGLHGANRECGQGLATTFPNGLFPIPSVRLDHALLSEHLACVSISAIPRTGSDHSALDLVIGLR